MNANFLRAHKKRLLGISIILSICSLAIAIRLSYVTLMQGNFLKNQGNIRTVRNLPIPAYRGIIWDRNGEQLALNIPTTSIWIDPKAFCPSPLQLNQLAELLDVTPAWIETRIKRFANKRFLYLKRRVNTQINKKIQNLQLPGLFLQTEYIRYYPQAESMAQIIGLTDIDNKGQEGLELAYHHWLQGKPGLKRILKNRLGQIIAQPKLLKPVQPGRDLQLSLDQRIQYHAFKELSTGIKQYHAEAGSAIVLDIKTGEILAMVSSPSYDPNKPIEKIDIQHRNRAVTDVFEPGSTLKSFSMVRVLESKQFTEDSVVDTTPGQLWIDNHLVRDSKNQGLLNLRKILQVSSNVGMSKLILSLPPDNFYCLLSALGFGETTKSGFPGERQGFLPRMQNYNLFQLATLSFGYGLSVTALQLAQAYATLANDGIRLPVTFLKQLHPPIGQRVITSTVSHTVLNMLESVLAQGGTAPLARIKGYRVIGKTGTTRIVGPQGYDKTRHNSIFVGIAPANQPRLVVLVILYDLRSNQYYSGSTAGIIFSKIMPNALRILNIVPDDYSTKK